MWGKKFDCLIFLTFLWNISFSNEFHKLPSSNSPSKSTEWTIRVNFNRISLTTIASNFVCPISNPRPLNPLSIGVICLWRAPLVSPVCEWLTCTSSVFQPRDWTTGAVNQKLFHPLPPERSWKRCIPQNTTAYSMYWNISIPRFLNASNFTGNGRKMGQREVAGSRSNLGLYFCSIAPCILRVFQWQRSSFHGITKSPINSSENLLDYMYIHAFNQTVISSRNIERLCR